MKDHFLMLAAYNKWANQKLHSASWQLSDDDYRVNLGASYKSMQGTLNHLLITDLIWMHRFTSEGQNPTKLDIILHGNKEDLLQAREALDQRITDYVGGLRQKDVKGNLTYKPIINPRTITQPLVSALSNMFNHQTHHRGQAHVLLTTLTDDAPALDLLEFQRETGTGMK